MLERWLVRSERGSFVRVALTVLAVGVALYAIVQAVEGAPGSATVLGCLVIVVLLRLVGVIPSKGLLAAAYDRWRR
jgi:uncharacterized membrane protein YidH (DUF202 family)